MTKKPYADPGSQDTQDGNSVPDNHARITFWNAFLRCFSPPIEALAGDGDRKPKSSIFLHTLSAVMIPIILLLPLIPKIEIKMISYSKAELYVSWLQTCSVVGNERQCHKNFVTGLFGDAPDPGAQALPDGIMWITLCLWLQVGMGFFLILFGWLLTKVSAWKYDPRYIFRLSVAGSKYEIPFRLSLPALSSLILVFPVICTFALVTFFCMSGSSGFQKKSDFLKYSLPVSAVLIIAAIGRVLLDRQLSPKKSTNNA